MNGETDELGLLGEYGVVIVPPSEDSGQWFVTLGTWDEGSSSYVAGTDGPIRETREEALEEANRVLNWLQTQPYDGDLAKVWELMQRRLGEEGLGTAFPRGSWPWTL